MTIRIHVTSVFVDDQDDALRFYTEVLGFELRADEPIGNGDRWLTVGAPGQDVELLLEPFGHPAVGSYRDALAADGIPSASFAVDDVDAEYERLRTVGVTFTQAPDRDGAGSDRGPRRRLRQRHPAHLSLTPATRKDSPTWPSPSTSTSSSRTDGRNRRWNDTRRCSTTSRSVNSSSTKATETVRRTTDLHIDVEVF